MVPNAASASASSRAAVSRSSGATTVKSGTCCASAPAHTRVSSRCGGRKRNFMCPRGYEVKGARLRRSGDPLSDAESYAQDAPAIPVDFQWLTTGAQEAQDRLIVVQHVAVERAESASRSLTDEPPQQ